MDIPAIDDTQFDTDEIRLMLRGDNKLTDADKRVIGAVAIDYLSIPVHQENRRYGRALYNAMKGIVATLPNQKDFVAVYNALKSGLKCKTNEKLLCYMMLAFKEPNDDLPIKLMHVYGRVQRLKNKNDWLNNFTINAYLDVLSLTAYHEFDNEALWTIRRENAAPINESVELNWDRVRKLLVGSLRDFMITHDVVPGLNNVNSLIGKAAGAKLSSKDVCDICNKIFACNVIGSHGCDCFFVMSDRCITIPEIYQVMKRYPSSTTFGVMNTQTYASRAGGEHWVYLGFNGGKANLICSEGSDFGCFKDNGKLKNEILKYFGTAHSMRKIQHDTFNCSFYSVLAAYCMLIHDNDIVKAVDNIADNATGLVAGRSIADIRSRLVNYKMD